jgi:hypothetical protein
MISFCIKKLSIPAEQRRVHSSLFAKSMSAIISGAAILPSFLGMNYGVQSGAYAAGKLATNLINKENNDKLQNPSITDTEAIELASLVEDLQEEIIVNYYRYKGALLKLKKTREAILLANKNYTKALDDNSALDIIITSSQWDDELLEEYKNLLTLRSDVLKAIEVKRGEGVIKSSQEVALTLEVLDDKVKATFDKLSNLEQTRLFIVSSVKETTLEEDKLEVSKVRVETHSGCRCERCWNKFDESEMKDNLCPRCSAAWDFYKDKVNE